MPEADRVTVTFLFSDIEGSTRLLERLGDRYAETLDAHRRIVRAALEACGGTEHGTEGDSFFASFTGASAAVDAVARIQRGLAVFPWRAGEAVRVRIGLHTGEAQRSGDGWVGLDVHRAARIAASGHGGQVLVSATTADLVRQSLPKDLDLRDLGSHRLKDLPEAERLFQLLVDGLPQEFPPPRGTDEAPNNLPAQLTSFVGRDRQLEEAVALLRRTRLLTLTGPGGTGKTRLSLRLAAEMLPEYPDGCWFVALAPVRDPGLVAASILNALGLQDSGSQMPETRLREHLRERRLLLVLDNFEQVLDAAPLVADLLRDAPGVSVVVTSRAALHVSGEQEFPVPPLAVPPATMAPAELHDPEALTTYESVALFVQRATAVQPSFALTADNAEAVARICARLDGLPLAIELAAARVKLLPPQALLTRLSAGLDVLDSQARDLPARQRTLRGAIGWSHELLDAPTRTLFARLSVFRGGWALEQAEQVCGGPPGDGVPAAGAPGGASAASGGGIDVLAGLEELVDHSLVRQVERHGEPRFLMLETIREYAAERLDAAGETDALRDRHAEVYLTLAEAGAEQLLGASGGQWLDRLEGELDNFRAALDWTLEQDCDRALRLGAALWRVWQMRGHLHEGRRRLEAMVAAGESADLMLRSRALEALGGVAYWQADIAAARQAYEAMLAIERERGDDARLADALYNVSFTWMLGSERFGGSQDFPKAVRLLGEALEIYRRLGQELPAARCLWALSSCHYEEGLEAGDRGEQEAATTFFRESLDYVDQSLEVFRRLDDWFDAGWALHQKGISHLRLGEVDESRAALVAGLDLFVEHRDVSGVVLFVDDLSTLADEIGRRDDAMLLRGAAARLRRETGTLLASLVNANERREDLEELGEADRARWEEGAAMPTDEIVALAHEV